MLCLQNLQTLNVLVCLEHKLGVALYYSRYYTRYVQKFLPDGMET